MHEAPYRHLTGYQQFEGVPLTSMCNLYSITTNQAAIIALFRAIDRNVGTCRRCQAYFLTILLPRCATMVASARS